MNDLNRIINKYIVNSLLKVFFKNKFGLCETSKMKRFAQTVNS